jgi:hypothetical protein
LKHKLIDHLKSKVGIDLSNLQKNASKLHLEPIGACVVVLSQCVPTAAMEYSGKLRQYPAENLYAGGVELNGGMVQANE